MTFLKVKGHGGYIKDTHTGIVLNVNNSEIEQAKIRKKQRRQQQNEINELKNEVSDIKQMLTKIVEKLNG
ncbi:MAG: hypothetical protein CMB20_001285 [Methanobacteriota archaeon]|nr:MAG: hypothetical protein CMB20_001285 [Euryarchaeota archaeon]|tara:strand:- start:792 stop:1001 length:210 start_codon:yes stop_codon:yes gene_type:complete